MYREIHLEDNCTPLCDVGVHISKDKCTPRYSSPRIFVSEGTHIRLHRAGRLTEAILRHLLPTCYPIPTGFRISGCLVPIGFPKTFLFS